MNKHVQRNKKVITKKTVDVKCLQKGQKLDSIHTINNLEGKFKDMKCSKQTGEEMVNKKTQVMKCDAQGPTMKENTSTNYANIQTYSHLKDATDSCTNLSSPGLCSALQLANEIKQASIEYNKPKTFNVPLESNERHTLQVVRNANIPFTKQIFRNLVDLQINDDDILPGKSLKTKNSNLDKKCDSAFILSNFYKPSFSTQCCAKIHSKKVNIEKVQFYKWS